MARTLSQSATCLYWLLQPILYRKLPVRSPPPLQKSEASRVTNQAEIEFPSQRGTSADCRVLAQKRRETTSGVTRSAPPRPGDYTSRSMAVYVPLVRIVSDTGASPRLRQNQPCLPVKAACNWPSSDATPRPFS